MIPLDIGIRIQNETGWAVALQPYDDVADKRAYLWYIDGKDKTLKVKPYGNVRFDTGLKIKNVIGSEVRGEIKNVDL